MIIGVLREIITVQRRDTAYEYFEYHVHNLNDDKYTVEIQ